MKITKRHKEIHRITKGLHGWLTQKEGVLLYETARNLDIPGPIIEIGSWCGKSTVWLGKGIKDSDKERKLYAVDPHTGASEHKQRYGEVWTLPQFKENIQEAGLQDVVEPMVMTSKEAASEIQEKPAFVFIDGAHEYEMVLLDFKLWALQLPEGGHVAFHDTMGRTGPTKVVRNNVYFSNSFKDVKYADSITLATKAKSLSLKEWLDKMITFLYREIMLTITYRISHYWGILKWHAYRKWKKRYAEE